MLVLHVIAGASIGLGCFVAFSSAVGALRFPDFFTRIHPAGKSDTLAQLLVCTGLVLLALGAADWQTALKLVLISGFLFLTTPSATHAIARAAHIDGKKPWGLRADADDTPVQLGERGDG